MHVFLHTDNDLDEAIVAVVGRHPNYGEKMIRGNLIANRINVSRDRIRESMKRVDPAGKLFLLTRCRKLNSLDMCIYMKPTIIEMLRVKTSLKFKIRCATRKQIQFNSNANKLD